ncbi:hypothetical protein [Clostridium phage phi CD119]|uniref:Uncharacterized protein n=1 Tax=Clostridium phage phiCD119 (strain Clostridium difficile/United States/Govind/2006) TaxID=2883936 RepID=Q24LH9_BPPCD|nr:hypothetical protein CDBPCV119_gp19 [Clostridium phage phi CD119]AAX53479.1 hypothetical protein [Clostridium phage phi CD119]
MVMYLEMWINKANETFRIPCFSLQVLKINSKAILNTSIVLKLGEIAVFGGVGLELQKYLVSSPEMKPVTVIIQASHHHMTV